MFDEEEIKKRLEIFEEEEIRKRLGKQFLDDLHELVISLGSRTLTITRIVNPPTSVTPFHWELYVEGEAVYASSCLFELVEESKELIR